MSGVVKKALPRLSSVIFSTKLRRCPVASKAKVLIRIPSLEQRRTSSKVASTVGARRRVVEEDASVRLDVSRRLTVGDHHDLLGAVTARELAPGKQERVLHVRPVHVVPGDRRQFLRPDLAGALGETDDAQVVPRELARDESLHGERDLLRGKEVVPQRHGKREVDQEHGRALALVLGPFDLEVLGAQPDREPDPGPAGSGSPCATWRRKALRMVRSISRLNGSPIS